MDLCMADHPLPAREALLSYFLTVVLDKIQFFVHFSMHKQDPHPNAQ